MSYTGTLEAAMDVPFVIRVALPPTKPPLSAPVPARPVPATNVELTLPVSTPPETPALPTETGADPGL